MEILVFDLLTSPLHVTIVDLLGNASTLELFITLLQKWHALIHSGLASALLILHKVENALISLVQIGSPLNLILQAHRQVLLLHVSQEVGTVLYLLLQLLLLTIEGSLYRSTKWLMTDSCTYFGVTENALFDFLKLAASIFGRAASACNCGSYSLPYISRV